jgi:hypothetical protein
MQHSAIQNDPAEPRKVGQPRIYCTEEERLAARALADKRYRMRLRAKCDGDEPPAEFALQRCARFESDEQRREARKASAARYAAKYKRPSRAKHAKRDTAISAETP